MTEPVIWWVRKDLRLGDNPALTAAIEAGDPVIPVFVLEEVFECYGTAPLWRFGLGVAHLARNRGDGRAGRRANGRILAVRTTLKKHGPPPR